MKARAVLMGAPHQTQSLGPYRAYAEINGRPEIIRWSGEVRPPADLQAGSTVIVELTQTSEWRAA